MAARTRKTPFRDDRPFHLAQAMVRKKTIRGMNQDDAYSKISDYRKIRDKPAAKRRPNEKGFHAVMKKAIKLAFRDRHKTSGQDSCLRGEHGKAGGHGGYGK